MANPTKSRLVEIDPEVLNGTPVIAGTTVPVQTLIEYRQGGLPLYEFLLDFPTVRPAQAKQLWAWLGKQDETELKALGLSKTASSVPQAAGQRTKARTTDG